MSPHCDLASVRAFVLLTPLLYLEAAAQVGPSITKPLANQSRSLGDRATFAIVATGDDPLSYQWHLNGSPIANATNRSITIKELTVAHAGSYTATVSNSLSAVTSNAAMLDVDTTFRLMVDSPVSRNAKWNVSWGDYDHDGYVDLFSAGEGQNRLFHNNGDGSFTAVGSTNAIVRRGNTGNDVHAIWADHDNDGNLDLFLPQGVAPARNQLYRGLGDGAFQLVTDAPVATDTTASFSAVWSDFNRDGRLDLFLSNVGPGPGQTATNIIYLGQPGGSFVRWGPTGLAKEFARHYGGKSVETGTTFDPRPPTLPRDQPRALMGLVHSWRR